MANPSSTDLTTPPLQRQQVTDDNGERELVVTISTRASLAINRLARRHKISHRDVIERMVQAEDERITASIELDSDEWDRYFHSVNTKR